MNIGLANVLVDDYLSEAIDMDAKSTMWTYEHGVGPALLETYQ
jgi:hypothetical protein